MPFQQRTNTSCYLAIPTHGFTVVLSVFWGTPPPKPLNCKSVSNRPGPPSRLVRSFRLFCASADKRAYSLRVGTPHRWNASAFLQPNSFGTLRLHQGVIL